MVEILESSKNTLEMEVASLNELKEKVNTLKFSGSCDVITIIVTN